MSDFLNPRVPAKPLVRVRASQASAATSRSDGGLLERNAGARLNDTVTRKEPVVINRERSRIRRRHESHQANSISPDVNINEFIPQGSAYIGGAASITT